MKVLQGEEEKESVFFLLSFFLSQASPAHQTEESDAYLDSLRFNVSLSLSSVAPLWSKGPNLGWRSPCGSPRI